MHRPELLAPAGSKEALIAAVENGADAVYFGGTLFSARQYASNFTRPDMEWAIDYAHIRGIRAYVTVNTLIKDSELEKAGDYLQFLCNFGADAVIVQDLGILELLREQLPDLPIHASTQMTIHNAEGVKFLQEMRVKRVVPARELSLDEIKRIKSQTAIEIETFIHGALCFSYSGQCLLSSMIGGRSGNRGYCAQPCRKKYRIDETCGYLLSPKDLNMSEHIPDLVEAGIDSFKIEGRMKRPEYVAGVVRIYRKLIDRYLDAPSDFIVTDEEKHNLAQLFNRGFTTGYFFGNPGNDLMSRKYPHNIGTELGKVIDYEPRRKFVSIHLTAPLRKGDGIGIGGKDTGIIIRNIYVNNKSVVSAGPYSTVKVPLEGEVAKGDMVYKTSDCQLMASLESKNGRKIPVKMSIKARAGEPVELFVSDGENEVTVQEGIACRAERKSLSSGSIEDQLKKLGSTIFESREITFDIEENIFIPVSVLNSLRRSGIAQLERTRAQKWKRPCSMPTIPAGKRKMVSKTVLSVSTGSVDCFEAAADNGADIVYIGGGEDFLKKEDYMQAIEFGKKKGVSVFFNTPRIIKEIKDLNTDMEPDGFLVSNPGILYYLRSLKTTRPVVIDYPFNVLNRLSMEYLLKYGQRITLSPELTLKEIRNLETHGQTECIVHGFFPLMVSEHGLAGCLFPGRKSKDVFMKDEKGFVFPVKTDSKNRTFIMNSRELCMLDYVPDIVRAGVDCLRIEAKTYDKEKTGKTTRAYRKVLDSMNSNTKCEGEHTTGHYFRGVL
ncbi:MAG: peptidase U32 [Candidatus Methanoperedens sp.]|nr:peptidase U32 [Candidatus Methanoperedens sp.]